MWGEIAFSVVTPVLTAAVMWWLFRGGDAEPAVEGDALVLRYPTSVVWFGVLIAASGLGLAALMAWAAPGDAGADAPAMLVVVSMFVACGAVIIAVQRRTFVRLTLDGLDARGVVGRIRHLDWSQVERVSFESVRGGLAFRSRYGTTVRASAYLAGIATLADVVERRCTARGVHDAVQALRGYRQPFVASTKR